MKTLGEIIKASWEYVQKKGSSHTRHEVEELIAFTLGKKRLDLYLNFDKPLNEEELTKVRAKLVRLAANEPLQYIEGKVQFYGCTIAVDPRVLIPRQETELLIDKVVKEIKSTAYQGKTLWDVCTGSGYIGIAIKKALPELTVTLSDISEDALTVAKSNSLLNNVDVELIQGDLLKPFGTKKADFIVCNPPYIAEGEYATLSPHVRDFEPKQALVPGKSGLECYERLITELTSHTNPGATVWFEIGSTQAEAICAMITGFKQVQVEKDLAGMDRFIKFKV